MSFPALRWAFEHALPTAGLKPNARFVLLALANFADEFGGNCYPSVATICEMTGFCDRTVQSLLQQLVQDHAIKIVSPGGGAKKTTRYQIIGDFGPYQNPEAASGKSARRTPKLRQEAPKPARGTPKLMQENPEAASGEPVTEPVKEPVKEPTASEISETQFQDFWRNYPRKAAKPEAEAKYLALLNAVPQEDRYQLEQVMLAGLRQFTFSDDPTYIPHPATWLNQRRWEDVKPEKPEPYGSGVNSPL